MSSIFSDRKPSDMLIIVDEVTTIGEFEDWYDGTILKTDMLPIDVAADLQRRNTEGPVPVAEFQFRSRQIVIDDLDELRSDAEDKYPGGVAFVRVSLPGYSRDGKIALVGVTNALSNHPLGSIFALMFSAGEWKVAGEDSFMGE